MPRLPRPLLATPLLLLLATLAVAQYPGSKPVDPKLKRGFDSITAESCRPVLEYLAGDECAGRGTGQPGYQKAAEYMAARFKEAGLKPIGDDGTYFQMVPFRRAAPDHAKSALSVEGKPLRLESGEDFSGPLDDFDLIGDVVFVSTGNRAKIEDVAGLAGKIVVLNAPRGLPSDLRRAFFGDQGPAAVLQVRDTLRPASERFLGPGSEGRRMPYRALRLTADAARKLSAACGVEAEALGTPADAGSFTLTPSGSRVRIVCATDSEDVPVPNVVGLIEGSDPELKNELVIMGSHLDHLGTRDNGQVFYGADDDGSGSTAVVALARAFAKNPQKPRRSIMFLAFCGEEMGLIGSAWYTDNPIVPLDRAVCELQMDMIGRNETGERGDEAAEDNIRTTHLVGSQRWSTELHDLILKANGQIGFTFEYDEEGVYSRSDHYNFAKHRIPIAFFFSGFHTDYHKPTDTVDKINFEKLANTAKLVYLIANEAANRDARLKVDRDGSPPRSGR